MRNEESNYHNAIEAIKEELIAAGWQTLANCSTAKARKLIDLELARKLECLPLGILGEGSKQLLTVATHKSQDTELINALRFSTGLKIKPILAPRELVSRAIIAAYHADEKLLAFEIENLTRDFKKLQDLQTKVTELEPELGSSAKLLERLILFTLAKNGSDLHIIPISNGFLVNIRVNGILHKATEVISGKKFHSEIISRIKVLCQLDTTKHLDAQDGSFAFSRAGFEINIRVGIMPTVYGEKAVLRFLGTKDLRSIKQLGLHPNVHTFLKDFLKTTCGGCLFAGPTGSGKSTTMYAALDYLKHGNLNIVTIEDPVEIFIPGISQTNIDMTRGFSFAKALQAILRHDPDVIMLGEIRDADSASISLQAAITGHLVLGSIHAKDVFEVLLRLKHFDIDYATLAQSIRLIVAQRLLPKLCPYCKEPSKLTNARAYISKGCNHCNQTGVSSRVLVTEALVINDAIKERISSSANVSIKDLLNPINYLSFYDSAESLLLAGEISQNSFDNLFN